jgi:ADP-heptose:LPS heptosyltransferase
MKIKLLKLIDRLVGVILTVCLPSAPVRPFTAPRHFLVIRPGGIGDAVLLIPTILALQKKYPAAQITVLAEKRNGAIFRSCPAVSKVLYYDNPKELLTAICGRYDVVIDTEQWHRLSAVVARLTGASLLIGYATNDRHRLFSYPISYSHDDYEPESFYHLLAPLHIVPPELVPLPFPHITPDLELRASALLGQLGESSFVVIFPGASIPERRWGADRFRQVAVALAGAGIPVVVVGGKEDAEEGKAIVSGTNGLNLAGKTTLAETAAVIAKGAVLVSGDSGVLHMGIGLGKHTVSLFGPSNIRKWAPKGSNHIVIHKNLQCSPCSKFGYTPKCPIKAKCMADITVDEVVAEVEKLLQKQGKPGEAQHI